MKHIKKVSSLILTAALVFSLSSCALVSNEDTDITNDNIKIGVILSDTSEAMTGTSGINMSAINELTDLDYGIDDDRFKYTENVNPDDANAVAGALKTLINYECSIIFATDPAYYDDLEKVATANPNVKFCIFNHNGNGANILGYKANITGASYISGIVAAMKADELKVPQLGYIAESDGNLTTMNAFAAGAKSVNKDIKIQLIISEDAKASSEKLVKNGCVVIASDYESEDIAKVADENDIFFVSFGTDFLSTYEDSYLCAPLYNFTQYYIDSIKSIVDDTKVEEFNGGFISGSTVISDLNDKTIANKTKDAVNKASDSLNAGSLKIELSAVVPDSCVTIVK